MHKIAMPRHEVRLFGGHSLRDLRESLVREAVAQVRDMAPAELRSANVADLAEKIADRYRLEPVGIDFDSIHYSKEHNKVAGNQRPPDLFAHSRPGQTFEHLFIRCNIPVSGQVSLLQLSTDRLNVGPEVMFNAQAGELSYSKPAWNDEHAGVAKREFERDIELVRDQLSRISRNVSEHNDEINAAISSAINERKQKLDAADAIFERIGLPIKKRDVQPVLAVPIQSKKIVASPDPTPKDKTDPSSAPPQFHIEEKVYAEILSAIHALGVSLERMPSLYEGRGEEALRDYFVSLLNVSFESASAETFNREGRVDILVRHEGSTVFAGECKFWEGEKGFLDTISQALSYLTWRDSKAAVIMFVRNESLANVLGQIGDSTEKHQHFDKLVDQPKPSWWNFSFELPTDEGVKVQVAVLIFHLPPPASARTKQAAGTEKRPKKKKKDGA